MSSCPGDAICRRRFRKLEEILAGGRDGNLVDEIRKCPLAGQPCGKEAFVEMSKQRLSRRRKALPQRQTQEGKIMGAVPIQHFAYSLFKI